MICIRPIHTIGLLLGYGDEENDDNVLVVASVFIFIFYRYINIVQMDHLQYLHILYVIYFNII